MMNLISKKEKDWIESICYRYSINNYYINSDGSIDVSGSVELTGRGLTKLPLVFNIVTGGFHCTSNKLTSLEGAPRKIGGSLYCGDNKLTSLVGGPTTVGGSFRCSSNQITSLEGAPTVVVGDFSCQRNKLSSTYTGYADLEIGRAVYLHGNNLPLQFDDNHDHMALVLKYQRHFEIWNDDLTLNVNNFNDLITEIKDGLK